MLSKFDILEIIDKAMETKDRYITIYASESVTTVSVYPVEDEAEEEEVTEDGEQ